LCFGKEIQDYSLFQENAPLSGAEIMGIFLCNFLVSGI
jgi:hypothetical protein